MTTILGQLFQTQRDYLCFCGVGVDDDCLDASFGRVFLEKGEVIVPVKILQRRKNTKVLILTSHGTLWTWEDTIKAGCVGL